MKNKHVQVLCLSLAIGAVCVGSSVAKMNATTYSSTNTTKSTESSNTDNVKTAQVSYDKATVSIQSGNIDNSGLMHKCTFTTKQNPGWVYLKDNEGKAYWFYTKDGINIQLGRFRVDGEGYCANPLTGRLFINTWVDDNKPITNPQSDKVSKTRAEFYDNDGKLILNYKPTVLAGNPNTPYEEIYKYYDGTEVRYRQIGQSGKTLNNVAFVTPSVYRGFVRLIDDCGNARYVYTPDGITILTGLQTIDGKSYYFDKYTGEVTNDAYLIDGTLVTKTVYNEARYGSKSHIGNINIPYFNKTTNNNNNNYNSSIKDGWCKVNEGWKFGKDGKYKVGWIKDKGTWYYLDPSTEMMQTGWKKINGKWYHFDANSGAMNIGWKKLLNKWFYLDSSGAMHTGWVNDKGTWYYLANNGVMRTGWVKDKGTWYYMDSSGAMQTGWRKINNNWYFFQGSGAMKTGWLKLGNDWYFLQGNGKMITRNFKYKGVVYRVNSSGVCTW